MTYSSASGGEGSGGGGADGGTSHHHHHHQRAVKHKRRYCKTPGCTRIVKSQGLCQRHGAVAKKCRVEGCPKQAQGNFNRMCKSHFKEYQNSGGREPASVVVVPSSNTSRSAAARSNSNNAKEEVAPEAARSSHETVQDGAAATTFRAQAAAKPVSVYEAILPSSVGWASHEGDDDDLMMPLMRHLKEGYDAGKPPGWHRREERQARGVHPTAMDVDADLDEWERELAWTEILVLSGSSDAGFAHLARAWGRDEHFHVFLSQFVGVGGGAAAAASKGPPAGDRAPNGLNHHSSGIASSAATSPQHHRRHPSSRQLLQQELQLQQQQRQDHHQRGLSMDLWMNDSFDFSGEFLFEDLESLASDEDEDDNNDKNNNNADNSVEEEEEEQETTAMLCEPCNNQAAV